MIINSAMSFLQEALGGITDEELLKWVLFIAGLAAVVLSFFKNEGVEKERPMRDNYGNLIYEEDEKGNRRAKMETYMEGATDPLFNKFANIGQPLLLETLDLVDKGTTNKEPQDDDAATYAHKIQKTEAMIDWQQNAQQVDRITLEL